MIRVRTLGPGDDTVVGDFLARHADASMFLRSNLLAAGLATRWAALGLSAVNVMAVVAYAHVLLGEGFEAALGQHWLWGTVLAVLFVFGPGRWSIDAWIAARRR